MAFAYQTKSWTIQGEQKLDDMLTLLNPTLTVKHVTVSADTIAIAISVTENGGIFEHHLGVQYVNAAGSTDLDLIVDDAMAQAFPEAVLNNQQ